MEGRWGIGKHIQNAYENNDVTDTTKNNTTEDSIYNKSTQYKDMKNTKT